MKKIEKKNGLLLLVPQQLKATERLFEKRIKWKRAFLLQNRNSGDAMPTLLKL